MLDKINPVGQTLDKAIIQLIAPGLIAVFPTFIIFLDLFPNAKSYLHSYGTVTILLLFFLALICGLLLEDIGSQIETKFFDRRNLKKDIKFNEIWGKYLLLTFTEGEPVGQRYLGKILLRMNFELSTGIAILPFTIGLIVLNHLKPFISPCFCSDLTFSLISCVIIYYLIVVEARKSSEILARTRKALVERFEFSKPI